MSTSVPYSLRIFSFYCRWANDLCKLTVGGNAMSHSKVKAGRTLIPALFLFSPLTMILWPF